MRHWRSAGLVLAAAFALSIVATAQDYRDYGYQGDVAERNAYNYGFQQGQVDRASGRRYNTNNGSNRVDKHFRGDYARGYEEGYNERQVGHGAWGWNNGPYNGPYNGPSNGPYGAYPSGGGYGYGNGNLARQYGYRDGFDLGANDARRGKRYNDHGSGAYKHANNGFPGGNKGAYQQEYRIAYEQGYRAGYEDASRGYGGYRRPY